MAGSLKLQLDKAEELFAASARFQAKTGAANALAARARILREAIVPDSQTPGETLSATRPFCVLVIDAHGYVQIGQGSRIFLGGTGGIMAVLVADPKYRESTLEAYKASHDEFVDWTSEVIDEVASEVGRDDNGAFNAIDLVVPPERPSVVNRQADDYWLCAYVLRWHINEGS